MNWSSRRINFIVKARGVVLSLMCFKRADNFNLGSVDRVQKKVARDTAIVLQRGPIVALELMFAVQMPH